MCFWFTTETLNVCFFNSLLRALNYHKCWFGHQLSLITVTYEQKKFKSVHFYFFFSAEQKCFMPRRS